MATSQYLIQVWPAPLAADASLKIHRAYAKQTGMTGKPIRRFNPPRPPGAPMAPPPGPRPHS